MLRSCVYCGRMHPVGMTCPKKPVRKFDKSSRAAKFRSSSAWKKKSQEIRRRDMGLCRVCLSEGVIETHGIEVHHIVPLEENFHMRLEDSELISLCTAHHKDAEAGRISRERLRELAAIPPGVTGAKKGNGARPQGLLGT